jgi:hypothetical protein
MFFGVGHVGRQMIRGTVGSPSLDLVFSGPTLDPRIAFTRASTATYFDSGGTMRTAATNAPRFDYDPVMHVLDGLLIEEQRTNLSFPSTGFSSGWTFVATVLGTGIAGPPDGTATLAPIAETTVTSAFYMGQLPTIAASTAYTLSVHAKAAENRYLQVALDDGNVNGAHATFDVQAGVISGPLTAHGTGVIGTASIRSIGNGFYRCAITTTIGAATTGRILFALSNTASPGFAPSYAGNAANGLLVWGAQLEAGAFPTSYIPTTAAAVTRGADTCTMPIGAWFNPSAYSLQFEVYALRTGAVLGGISDNAFGDAAYMGDPYWNAGATLYGNAAFTVGVVNKACGTYNSSPQTVSCSNNGAAPGTVASTLPAQTTAIRLSIGCDPWSMSVFANEHIRRVRYWPRVLSNSEMQSVTAPDPNPTLDLVFSGPTLDPLLTFTRASTATYFDSSGVMQTAAVNAPRFDYDPMTHAVRGLLIEEARTNSVAPSVPSVGNWIFGGPMTLGGSVTAPDGTTSTTSQVVSSDTTNSIRQLTYNPSIAVSPTTTYTITAFLKSSPINCHLQVNAGGAAAVVYVDLTNGTALVGADLVPGIVNPVVAVTPLMNGWYRLRYTFTTPSAGTTANVYLGPCITVSSSGDNRSYVGVVGQGIYVWGVQFETGAFATSYIPTTAAAVTRAADRCQMPTVAWFTNTLAFSVAADAMVPNVGAATLVQLDDGSSSNRALLASAVTTGAIQYFESNGVTTANSVGAGTPPLGVPFKTALATTAGRHSYVLNGSTVFSSGNAAAPPPITTLRIGNAVYPTEGSFYLRRMRYWPRALSDSEIQVVTT